MNFHYSAERNVQMVLALFKAYGIKRVIASPGAINIPVVASMQQDPYFEMFSCVDERSAAYMACGMAEESNEPVVLSCTGATASRNYMPGMTEAYYRKLPVIALTSSRDAAWIGHLFPQVTDRMAHPNDICVDFEHIQTIKDETDEWDVTIKLNRALNAIKEGPVHINITDAISRKYDVLKLPEIKKIPIFKKEEDWPVLPQGKIAIFCGEHKVWPKEATETLDHFCACHDAVVFCDHTSKFHGKYRFLSALVGAQKSKSPIFDFNLIIHIGEVSGGYDVFNRLKKVPSVWRVSPDGKMKDFFRHLSAVFQTEENTFFKHYIDNTEEKDNTLNLCLSEYQKIYNSLPELPFSNIWIGKEIGRLIPDNSVLYLGILNSLRSWNFFEINPKVRVYSNVGGFGIDGSMSSTVGASLVNPDKLCFVVLGDLSFFYDMNCIGNRDIGNNLRILLINNGKGIEFRHYNHQAQFLGEDADKYVAAAHHWGNQSHNLVRHFAQDLGFKYLTASNKNDFKTAAVDFLDTNYREKSILFEVFTDTEEEIESLKIVHTIQPQISQPTSQPSLKDQAKNAIKGVLGDKIIEIAKIIRK